MATCENAWGEISQLPPGDRLVLLGEQADIVGEADEPVEQGARPPRPRRRW
jgi:hypothetical protein